LLNLPLLRWRPLALLILAALLGFWWLPWQSPATLGLSAKRLSTQDAKYGLQHTDDD